jgi:general secretion pathway protein I
VKRSRGFTLLEVAVAIAVVAIGLIGAFNAIIQSADATARLRERALADWIAMNQISTMRLSGEFPEVDEYDGDVEFAGRAWYWSATVSETGVEDLRRIDMNVAWEETPDDPVTIMTGFVSRRVQGSVARIDWWGATAGPGPGPDDAGDEGDERDEEDLDPGQDQDDQVEPPIPGDEDDEE